MRRSEGRGTVPYCFVLRYDPRQQTICFKEKLLIKDQCKEYLTGLGLRALLKFIEVWMGSCRVQEEYHPEARALLQRGKTGVGAFWHSQILYLLYYLRKRPAAIMVSGSSDGQLVVNALELWNQYPVRGSRFKGGSSAVREMARLMKEKNLHAGIVADGSRGPAQKVQVGALILSRTTGRPVVPIACAAKPAYYFGSWDRMFLPLPLSRVAVVFGEPLHVPADARGRGIEGYRQKLQEGLNQATHRAGQLVGIVS